MTREEELWAAIIAALKNENYAGELPAAPSWRSEEFLMGILAGIKGVSGAKVPKPAWNDEKYLAAIFDQVDGGVVKCKLLASQEFAVNTSSTTSIDVGTVAAGAAAYTSDKIIYVRVRDKAGVRDGYFTESDSWFINPYPAKGKTYDANAAVMSYGRGEIGTSKYGVYPFRIDKDGKVYIVARYSSSYGTIDGTYVVEVYALEWPDRVSPFVAVS